MIDPAHLWPRHRSDPRARKTGNPGPLSALAASERYITVRESSHRAFNQFVASYHSLDPIQVPEGMSLQQFLDIQEMSRGD